jgi:hypothetical protein
MFNRQIVMKISAVFTMILCASASIAQSLDAGETQGNRTKLCVDLT